MEIFDFKDNKLVVNVEALTYPHISAMYDKTKDNSTFYKYCRFIALAGRWNSAYKAFPKDEQLSEIKKDVFGDYNYIIPDYVMDALNRHKEFAHTPATRLLDAAEEGVDYLIAEYKSLEAKRGQVDKAGKPIVGATEVYKWLGNVASVMENLKKLQSFVMEERSAGTKVMKGGDLNPFENPE